MGFVRENYKKPLFWLWIVLLIIIFWRYPIASDIREIKDHLLRIDQKNERLMNYKNDHDREIVKTKASADIVKQLEQIELSVKNVRQSLDTVDENDKKVISGINDHLGRWEISVYDGNKLNLKINDMVVISNKTYGEHRPSAMFKVTNISEKTDSNVETEIFMSAETAEFLDIPNATGLGKFEVSVRALPKHRD